MFVSEDRNKFVHLCNLCHAAEKWHPCGTSLGQGSEGRVARGLHRQASLAVSAGVCWYLPPPETKHILSLAHPLASSTGSHCSLCVKDPATPCARTMLGLYSPSLWALLISFPFYFPLCGRVHKMKLFLLFKTGHFKGWLLMTHSLSVSLHWGFPSLWKVVQQIGIWFKAQIKWVLISQQMYISLGNIWTFLSEDAAFSYL